MASPRLTEPIIHITAGQALFCPLPSPPESDAIREHLEHILASPGFRNSKRVSGVLRYVVEQSLLGRADRLKERTIGIEVFGRAADYDTNVDHSVRSAAGEVRKRLAQYYMECHRSLAFRIDLQPGSYVPQFHRTAEKSAEDVPVAVRPLIPAAVPPPPRRSSFAVLRRYPVVIVAGVAAIAAVGVALAVSPSATAFDRFWAPVFDSSRSALVCVGGGSSAPLDSDARPLTIAEFEQLPNRRMNVSDATVMALMTGVLEGHHKPYRLLDRAPATSFQELQQGPAILIGALNNPWSLRLLAGARFSFNRGPNGAYVSDKQNPSDTSRTANVQTSIDDFNRDYAIVSRLRDPKTGQSAVIIGGLLGWGTLAAGQFVSDPDKLCKLAESAPAGWEKKNLQILLATEVINGSSGPPQILAVHYW